MFRCEYSKELSDPGERPVTVVIETRLRQYKNDADEVYAEGTEIVKEIKVREINVAKVKARYGIKS